MSRTREITGMSYADTVATISGLPGAGVSENGHPTLMYGENDKEPHILSTTDSARCANCAYCARLYVATDDFYRTIPHDANVCVVSAIEDKNGLVTYLGANISGEADVCLRWRDRKESK